MSEGKLRPWTEADEGKKFVTINGEKLTRDGLKPNEPVTLSKKEWIGVRTIEVTPDQSWNVTPEVFEKDIKPSNFTWSHSNSWYNFPPPEKLTTRPNGSPMSSEEFFYWQGKYAAYKVECVILEIKPVEFQEFVNKGYLGEYGDTWFEYQNRLMMEKHKTEFVFDLKTLPLPIYWREFTFHPRVKEEVTRIVTGTPPRRYGQDAMGNCVILDGKHGDCVVEEQAGKHGTRTPDDDVQPDFVVGGDK